MIPFFSIIAPVYNVELYLRKCVDSILAQTFTDFELILVDDGSPDNCPAICDEYAGADSRISVIHKKNTGPSPSRKAGLLKAEADYVVFIDSDDFIPDDYLERIHRWITENNRPDMILHGFTCVYDNRSKDKPPLPEPGYYDKTRMETEIYPRMLLDCTVPDPDTQLIPGYLWNKPGKRELYLKYFLSDDRIRIMEDMAMIYDVLYHADSLYVAPDCIYYYLIHGNSALSKYKPDFFRTSKLVYDYIEAHLVADYPPARQQLQNCTTIIVLDTIWGEFRHGHTFKAALHHIRNELTETGLYRYLNAAPYSGLKKLYIILLQHRIFLPVVCIARLQTLVMPKQNKLRYN